MEVADSNGVRSRPLVANHVRKFRQELLLTQSQLARRAGLSRRCVGYLEAGYGCHQETKRRILRALRVPFERRGEVFPPDGHG